MEYEIHPAAEYYFPIMADQALAELTDDIKAKGLKEAITILDGKILDGRNRYTACRQLGIEPKVELYSDPGDPLEWVWSKNFTRRHLTGSQKAAAVAKRANAGNKFHGNQHQKVVSPPGGLSKLSVEQAAKDANVSRSAAYAAKAVLEANTKVFKQIESGKLSVKEATKLIAKDAKPKSKTQNHETYAERIARTAEICRPDKPPLTREQIDPDFNGSAIDWVDKHGHVQIRTDAQKKIDDDKDNFTTWVGAIRSLRVPLREYLKVGRFTVERYHNWIKKARAPEQRIEEINELVSLIVETRESIDWLIALLAVPQNQERVNG